MNIENFNNLIKSQAVRRVCIESACSESDVSYNNGLSDGIASVIAHTVLDYLRLKFNLFIWISPVCDHNKIIGYTYEGEFALQQNNTFSDMGYEKFTNYKDCISAAVDYSFQHAYENKYVFN